MRDRLELADVLVGEHGHFDALQARRLHGGRRRLRGQFRAQSRNLGLQRWDVRLLRALDRARHLGAQFLQVDRGELLGFRASRAWLRGQPAVERHRREDPHALQADRFVFGEVRGPDPGLARLQLRQRREHLLLELLLVMVLDPAFDRVDVLRADEPVGHQDLRLGGGVLVQSGRPLRDGRQPDAARTAFGEQPQHAVEHDVLLRAALAPGLGHEPVRLFAEDVDRLLIALVETVRKSGRHLRLLAFGHAADTQDEVDAVIDQDVGQQLAGRDGGLERQVGVPAAEDVHFLAALAGAVRAGLQAPPDVDGIQDRDRDARIDELLSKARGGTGLAGAALADQQQGLRGRIERQMEPVPDVQVAHLRTSFRAPRSRARAPR